MNRYKLELSLLAALTAMLICCAAFPQPTFQWWGAAFAPLCDGILTSDGADGILLRSKLLELLAHFMHQ